jgi:hypothetical protein
MLNLESVTLLCVETREPALAHWAIERCLRGVSFASVVLLTDLDRIPEKKAGIHYVQAPKIQSTKDYSDLLLTGIEQYVEGSHVLVMQWDSFITRPDLWQDHFLDYDYVGAVWPHHPENPVGNGGFSLRSKKLLEAIKQPGFVKRHPEDYCICVDNKKYLEEQCGIRFAPPEIADNFAVERAPWHNAFGFHGFFNFANVLNDSELQSFISYLPKSLYTGLDVYDLIQSLIDQNRLNLAKKIAKKVQFKWRLRKRYLNLRLWLLGLN